MTPPATLADDEETFRALGQALADAIERELAGWVEAQVAAFWVDELPSNIDELASEAGAQAAREIAPKIRQLLALDIDDQWTCLLYTSPSPRDKRQSRMPSSA